MSAALETALAYYEAWKAHDLDRAMTYIADDIVCDAPAGRLEGAAAYRAFLTPFVGMLKSTTLVAAFGDEQKAMIMYDAETVPVPSAPGAECVAVVAGKIIHSRFLFDRSPFEAARRQAGTA